MSFMMSDSQQGPPYGINQLSHCSKSVFIDVTGAEARVGCQSAAMTFAVDGGGRGNDVCLLEFRQVARSTGGFPRYMPC